MKDWWKKKKLWESRKYTKKSPEKRCKVAERTLSHVFFSFYVTFKVLFRFFRPFLIQHMILSLWTELSLCPTPDLLILTYPAALATCLSSQAGAIPDMAHIPAAATITSYPNISNFLSLPRDEGWAWPQIPLCASCVGTVAGPGCTPNLVFPARGCPKGQHQASKGNSVPCRAGFSQWSKRWK